MDMECLGSSALTTITDYSGQWIRDGPQCCDVMSDPNTLSYAILGTLSDIGNVYYIIGCSVPPPDDDVIPLVHASL